MAAGARMSSKAAGAPTSSMAARTTTRSLAAMATTISKARKATTRSMAAAGADRLYGGEGDDTIHGGYDDDTFVFAAGHGNDTIQDFTDGEDSIDLTQITGITAFDDLTITADGTTAVIDLTDYGGGTIRLENIDVSELDAEDFNFYEAPADPVVEGI